MSRFGLFWEDGQIPSVVYNNPFDLPRMCCPNTLIIIQIATSGCLRDRVSALQNVAGHRIQYLLNSPGNVPTLPITAI